MSVSLLDIKNRDPASFMHSVKNVRICKIWTPSSFYVQLPDEDIIYNKLERDMLQYYNGATIYSYCCALNNQTPNNCSLRKLKRQDLKVSI